MIRVVGKKICCPDDASRKFLSTKSCDFILASGFSLKGEILLYIIFIKFFLPIIPTLLHFLLIILPHVILSAFILISGFKCFFLMFLTFTCAPVHPSTCLHFSFMCSDSVHNLFQVTMTSYIFYVLSLLRSWFIPTQYINRCIFLVVLQFVNWRWFSSSPILSLSFSLPSKLSLLSRRSPRPLVTIYLLRRTSDLWSYVPTYILTSDQILGH